MAPSTSKAKKAKTVIGIGQRKLGFTSKRSNAAATSSKAAKNATLRAPAPSPASDATQTVVDVDSDGATVISSPTPVKTAYVKHKKLDMDDKAGAWSKYGAIVEQKMGNQDPVHAENETRVSIILRVFDMSYEYGPFSGASRLDRWNRAKLSGLNPPIEVYEILTTQEAIESSKLSHSVLQGLI